MKDQKISVLNTIFGPSRIDFSTETFINDRQSQTLDVLHGNFLRLGVATFYLSFLLSKQVTHPATHGKAPLTSSYQGDNPVWSTCRGNRLFNLLFQVHANLLDRYHSLSAMVDIDRLFGMNKDIFGQ